MPDSVAQLPLKFVFECLALPQLHSVHNILASEVMIVIAAVNTGVVIKIGT